jgi:hypothetical protein
MRNCIFVLLFWSVVLACGMAAAQESPALTPKNPIALTKVEGRMDHLGVDVKGQRLFAAAFDNHTLGTTFQLLQTVKLSSDADNIRYDARSKHVLVGYGGEKFLFGKVVRGQGDGALAFLIPQGRRLGRLPSMPIPNLFNSRNPELAFSSMFQTDMRSKSLTWRKAVSWPIGPLPARTISR